jgi:hypothetical protein
MSLRKALKAKRTKRGLSGAVTALILVIASVIIALVVVGFAFGLFGALGGTPTVTQVGTGSLYYNSNKNDFVAVITLHSTGNNVYVESATIVGTIDSAGTADIVGTSLSVGVNTVTISFPSIDPSFNPQPGTTYQISIGLSDGTTVQAAVTYTG